MHLGSVLDWCARFAGCDRDDEKVEDLKEFRVPGDLVSGVNGILGTVRTPVRLSRCEDIVPITIFKWT